MSQSETFDIKVLAGTLLHNDEHLHENFYSLKDNDFFSTEQEQEYMNPNSVALLDW